MNYFLLSFLSFFVGIVVGLTGVGGASLITPMLIFVFQVPASIAISSDVVSATLMKVVGGFKHWQQKTLDLQVVKWLALGSVPGSLGGVWILHCIKCSGNQELDCILLRCLGIAIALIVALSLSQLLLKIFLPNLKLPSPPEWDLNTNSGRIFTVSAGAILGCIVGITSVSSGAMFALLLIAFFRLDASKLVGTDISQAAILLMFTSVGHLSLGTVNWSLVLPIWLGSVPGVLVGAKFCKIMPQRPLKFVIYGMLAMASWKLYQV
ncbi:MAG: sulfite exporter TauE/SafE family protein [Microcoleus sp. PH2017_10_PVI_O_A]|uniref:sulfite exporter TauE/SafE family protein n=1 Tax=unclassified Microcoleus TaxID=2642155 RepID=UPI001DF8737B|nr:MULTISPECIES: sulfite exporter TauE/SafE family protein [unclassified Microcoleus]TAE80401.1 MAG: sulfite exporter TauE/SafE family protein [Oscillatoriales cyanobacterium]MCC3407072.1 sulfite exporter TauE/SafE family protein [Microcoleus sp. PH2017_10_PVI_O_A]MCC3461826.1 sulfite exporter TauE/SafE family protein [Microcoleus sp. PH2017_11_PCY_U_A]MCC3477973.1 sulfite exporter TauE/SafE family protein [Microcoleus sp. PH2017_12_PCY_D_A]MCC3529081.1 sulfite exporter TauE/SafE family protei